jgi:uncharacterized repeat protein (TIGR01451 family)
MKLPINRFYLLHLCYLGLIGSGLSIDLKPVFAAGIVGEKSISENVRSRTRDIALYQTTPQPSIAGKVFEDINYGGGAGRSFSSSNGANRPNVRVELYGSTGNYIGKTFTNTNGEYVFNKTNIPSLANNTSYQVRVVNGFVTSSRGGACTVAVNVDTLPASCTQVPVQTFRTNSGTADPNRVGGENPARIDAAMNSGSQTLASLNTATTQVQSIATVTIPNGPITGVDFGFNFDTIVNTNDSGQGSLRQFITNSNALANTNLAQVGQIAGDETSIFMIPNGNTSPGLSASIPSQLTSGVAQINITSSLPIISGTNANNTVIDGRTQTANIGDTNSGQLGTGGTVGVDGLPLNKLNAPEIEIKGINSISIGLYIQANNIRVQGIAIYGFSPTASTDANIEISDTATNPFITENAIGITARSLSDPGLNPSINLRTGSYGIYTASRSGIFSNNIVSYNGRGGIELIPPNNSIVTTQIIGNEIRGNAILDSKAEGTNMGGGSGGVTVRGNLFADNGGPGIDTATSTGGNVYENNTVINNGSSKAGIGQTSGLRITGANNLIARNIIANNYGAGILVRGVAENAVITQNSIYGNGTISTTTATTTLPLTGQIGIDLAGTGSVDTGSSPFVTPNDNGDVDTGDNTLLNFPVITGTIVRNNKLVVVGFAPAGSKIELFIADGGPNPPGTNYTKVFGEGQTYLTARREGSADDLDSNTSLTYTDDGTGATTTKTENKFKFEIPLGSGNTLNGQVITNTTQLTATATKLSGNSKTVNGVTYELGATSEFSGITNVSRGANVLMVKRITAINGDRVKNPNQPSIPLNTFVDDPDTHDNNAAWPTTPSPYLIGQTDVGKVKPGDNIEYTIYFINAGDLGANDVRICDRLQSNQTFNLDTYGTGKGIELKLGTSTAQALTNASDTVDRARWIIADPNPGNLPTKCNLKVQDNPNGILVVDVTGAANTGVPVLQSLGTQNNNSYGFIRFITKVK